MTGLLDNKSVLVTGAFGGIGTAVAESIGAAGAFVIATDIFPDTDSRVPALIDLLEHGGIYLPAEITDNDSVARLIEAAAARGGLDGAANVAGIVGPGFYTADFPEDAWLKVVSVNMHGTWLCLKHEIKQMMTQDTGGSIVNIASIAGHNGEVLRSPYVASKAGVLGLTKTAGIEYADKGIRVNAVSPGPIETPQYRIDNGEPGSAKYDSVARSQPIGRLGRPHEIADAVVWLLSDHSSFVVGQEIIVDGGVTAESVFAARMASYTPVATTS